MIKKTFLLAVFALGSFTAIAQKDPGFGIKAGLNYGANGDYFESTEDAYKNPDSNVGYHVGFFGKVGTDIYFRPELVYTKTKSDYENNSLDMSKLDLPLLVGVNLVGPLQVFAGPSFQYILDTDFDGITIGDVENDFTVGLNIGAGISFGKFGIDLRYERGFTENEVTVFNSNGITTGDRIDTRPDQLILSLAISL
ncbi:Outer membrane protein beta-barrel domain-containing protein [Arenibacter nanhaiticus]|uniref:Outer membrane protein beta-barrel domain-containing protein n=1 Tax=Arenibacter nanhaiticus TaxID=558155 RepID=A0A1M6IE38_9FLAO|nr:Outer membrane protein beta-barrel domain-containing protein [Arenibacter nanhaiticus]